MKSYFRQMEQLEKEKGLTAQFEQKVGMVLKPAPIDQTDIPGTEEEYRKIDLQSILEQGVERFDFETKKNGGRA